MHEKIYPFHNIDIEYSYQFVSTMIGVYALQCRNITQHFKTRKRTTTKFERTSLPMLLETEPFHTILKVYSVNSFENALCFQSLPVTRAHFFTLHLLLSFPGAQVVCAYEIFVNKIAM